MSKLMNYLLVKPEELDEQGYDYTQCFEGAF